MRVLLTGGTGYIGARVVAAAQYAGMHVTLLARHAGGGTADRVVSWDVDRPVPAEAFEGGIDAVIHLAHDWRTDDDGARNIAAAAALRDAARAHGVRRFIFGSSVAAHPEAMNKYGRLKRRIEDLFDGDGEAIARIGLVYGGPMKAMYGTICAMVKLPVLPMVRPGNGVQPIHVDEVATGLLAILRLDPLPRRIFHLAAARPMTFGTFLKMLARARFGRPLAVLPLPLAPMLLACDLTAKLPLLPTVDRERVLGLAGLRVVDSADDLACLGLTLRDPALALAAER